MESRSRSTLLVCLVAIAGGVIAGLVPLGLSNGAEVVSSGRVDRLASEERERPRPEDTRRSSTTTQPVATVPNQVETVVATESPVPAPIAWIARLSGRETPTKRAAFRTADVAPASDGEPFVSALSWWFPAMAPEPVVPVRPAGPVATSPPRPSVTSPPTTVPAVPTTQPEVPTTEPEVPTTVPEVPTTEPEAPTTTQPPEPDPPDPGDPVPEEFG